MTTMQNLSPLLPLSVVCVIISMFIGCSDTPGDQPPLTEVTGRVLLDNQPLANAGVSFRPVAGARGAYGKTDRDGRFRLAYVRSTGAPLGRYQVEISTKQIVHNNEGEGARVSPETVPARYNSKTELTADVVGNGENFFEFELKSH